MRTYEALYIIRPDWKEDEIQTVADEVIKLVTDNGGAIVRSEIWGKRRLAYEVKKFTEGIYVLLRFEANPNVIPKLEDYFRLSETVIRFLIVYMDDKTLRLEALQQKRREEEVLASATARHDDDDDDDDDIKPRQGRRRIADDDDDDDDD